MADYISREAVIETIKGYGKEAISAGRQTLDPVGDTAGMAYLISVMPAADVAPVRRWIPCSERLPEIGATVLTLDKYKHVKSRVRKSYVGGTPYFYPDGLEPNKHITHWMPLPGLPKKEGK